MGIFKNHATSKGLCQVTAPEVKIFLIFCYLLAFYAVLWTSITYGISKSDELVVAIGSYFQCSINGVHDQLDCEQHRREFEDISIRWLHVLYPLIGAFLNVSNLPLIIEYQRVKAAILSTLSRDTVKETEQPSYTKKSSELQLAN